MTPSPPLVLCIGGHDPTGGAGIQADIETVTALGGRALTLLTQLTEQDTGDVRAMTPNPPAAFARQCDTLLADITPDAVKIGLTGSAAIVERIAACLRGFQGPVVVDPVLAAGGGFDLAGDGAAAALATLVSSATLVTPNRAEARRLAGLDDPVEAARALVRAGAGAVLLTGADEADGAEVTNLLVRGARAPIEPFRWPRLPGCFHGSGCTLAAACAARLAFGDDIAAAVQVAQAFTERSLRGATRPGRHQAIPRRTA